MVGKYANFGITPSVILVNVGVLIGTFWIRLKWILMVARPHLEI